MVLFIIFIQKVNDLRFHISLCLYIFHIYIVFTYAWKQLLSAFLLFIPLPTGPYIIIRDLLSALVLGFLLFYSWWSMVNHSWL